ncbi:hypothetical protein AAJ76_1300069544 [Vairimorpha ceranae]|uniref:Uncharacterized protein n=1 Tax=Vairimorpha ceranae TaxID=40302 RepID=A0A0F9WG99_9MICR|nr:hypothetical protein AAJ76_1300069544 [Vairimorpha ceranae]KKO75760.1 hypothetical protein AAJ76_1300069544 [Vairimorpha ceranae]
MFYLYNLSFSAVKVFLDDNKFLFFYSISYSLSSYKQGPRSMLVRDINYLILSFGAIEVFLYDNIFFLFFLYV